MRRRIQNRLSFELDQIKKRVWYTFKSKKYFQFNPVFLIGCGRSGTTILANTLAAHPGIYYLNEPRRIWSAGYPSMDVWSEKGFRRGSAKLVYTESDLTPNKVTLLQKKFKQELFYSGANILLEKLPINTFRLKLIKAIFPQARFIYLYRNGLEVARSIGKVASRGWFGFNDLKLQLLIDFASKDKKYQKILQLIETDLDKGMLEWRLSMDASDAFFKQIPHQDYYTLSYQDLVNHPKVHIEAIIQFLELPLNENISLTAQNNIKRRTSPLEEDSASNKQKNIGGEILIKSIKNTYKPG